MDKTMDEVYFLINKRFRVYFNDNRYFHYHSLLNNWCIYNHSNGLRYSTIAIKAEMIVHYFKFLVNNDITMIDNITIEATHSFLNNYDGRTKSDYGYCVREFLNFMFNNGLISFTGTSVLPLIRCNKKRKTLSFYTNDEVRRILSVIDISSKQGKRDYLIISLAAELGLRCVDIKSLKFSDINLDAKTISIIQSKTSVSLTTILSDNLYYAILDYWFNSRPDIKSDFILINDNGRYDSNNNFYKALNKYIRLANININGRKHGLHSLRHSLASSLLTNNVSMTVISSVLGQQHDNTVRTYLSIDINSLQQLALKVPFDE